MPVQSINEVLYLALRNDYNIFVSSLEPYIFFAFVKSCPGNFSPGPEDSLDD